MSTHVKMKIKILIFTFFAAVLAFTATAESLPSPNHEMLFGYYHVDSQYGDFKDEVKDYTNTQIILEESWIRSPTVTNEDIQKLNDAFNESIDLGHKIVYLPAKDPSNWNQSINLVKPYWQNIEFIYLADKPSWDKTTTENQINNFKQLVSTAGLTPKQIAIKYTPAQILNGNGYQASNLDIIGLEAYVDSNLQDSANLVETLNRQLDQLKQKTGSKKIFFVIQAYDRNNTWRNLDSLVSIQTPPYLKAYNDSRVIGLFAFSYARPGGTRDNSILKQAHQAIGEKILGRTENNNTVDNSSIVTKSIDPGTFPDVAWYEGKVWMAVQQTSRINIYKSSSNLSDLHIERQINFRTTSGQAFPRLAVHNDNLWMIYRDNDDDNAKLWNLKTGTTQNLGPSLGSVAIGYGYIAWQKPNSGYPIMRREIEGAIGSEQNVSPGKPTGLSRILEDGTVLTADDDRNAIANGTNPSFAGPLAVVEGQNAGSIVVNTEDSSVLATLFDGQIAFTPRIATDNKGNYAVVTWGAAGLGVRIATFKGPEVSTTFNSNNRPFGQSPQVKAPTEGLPTDLGELIEWIFGWSLGLLGLSVFLMIFYAGFLWLTAAGNTSRVGQARDIINNAIIGAIILVSSYVILYTINPDFIKSTFNLPGLNYVAPPTASGTPTITPPAGTSIAQKAQQLINLVGINSFSNNASCGGNFHARQNIQDIAGSKYPAVCSSTCSSSNLCAAGGSTGNINVNPAIFDGLAALRNRDIRFTVTSFTTGKHAANSKHYTGNAVDIVISPAAPTVWQEARVFLNSRGGSAICEDNNSRDVQSCGPIPSVVDHIHWQL